MCKFIQRNNWYCKMCEVPVDISDCKLHQWSPLVFSKIPNMKITKDLKFNNIHWQVLETESETYYLYEAYLDVRKHNTLGPSVRILGMVKQWKNEELFCHFWVNSSLALTRKGVQRAHLIRVNGVKQKLSEVRSSRVKS